MKLVCGEALRHNSAKDRIKGRTKRRMTTRSNADSRPVRNSTGRGGPAKKDPGREAGVQLRQYDGKPLRKTLANENRAMFSGA